jgi:MSHA biogenesis protein MshI
LRWLRRAAAAPAVQVGLQFAGDRLLLARLRHGAGGVEFEAQRSLAAPAAQRTAVLRQLKQQGLFRRARLHLLLAPGQYDLHQTAAPPVAADDLHDALRWQLRGALGYPAEEALLDFAALPQPADAPARPGLLAVTARRSLVAEVLAPLAACGLTVDAIDVPEFAQRNLARHVLPDEAGSHAWLAFDDDTFLLTAHCLGELAFARRMLLPSTAMGADGGADAGGHFVERVLLQVQRSLDLFERQSGLPPVTRIVVGPHRYARAVADELAARAGVGVQLAEAAPLLQPVLAAGNAAASAALGAALRPSPGSVQAIDLYRGERQTAEPELGWRVPTAAALAALAVGVAAHLWLEAKALDAQRATAMRLRDDVQRAEKLLLALGTPAPAGRQLNADADADVVALEALATRLTAGTLGRREPFAESLRALARARTDGVWLTGIRLAHGGALTLEGKALDAERLPQFLAALQHESHFAGAEFARIEMHPARDPAGAVQFRITSEALANAGAGR